jgi:glutamate synthase (NADPH/NADH) large chain
MPFETRPEAYGLYDPAFEKESCGVGFVAHIKGKRSHDIVTSADTILRNMEHRGAVGSEKNTGDGAGMLVSLPYEFLEKISKQAGVSLPERGHYAAGLVFLPKDEKERGEAKKRFEGFAKEEGLSVLLWRKVPVDNSMLGPTAVASEPAIEQVIVAPANSDISHFDQKLFVVRKMATHQLRGSDCDRKHFFYVCSLSTKVMIYKGMLTPDQVMPYFKDLSDPDFQSHLAMIHSRFSTNTFPSWDRAQPLRFMSHNGEINTLRGNVNKMTARQGSLKSEAFGENLRKAYPIIEPDLSDSGNFDNVLELLLLAGRELPEAVMMMIPEAWQNHQHMSDEKKAFYEYHSCLMEPWDGPASIAFTDGKVIGAVLDRNGLRPSRFYVTDDDLVIMASEVGVLNVDPSHVKIKGRLQPGKMFLVNFEEGRIVDDEEIKKTYSTKRPYRQWLNSQKIRLGELKANREPHGFYPDTLLVRMKTFGYTQEHLNLILKPMTENSQEPLGSMGNDTPLAVLSGKSKLTYEYFKQLFAQVTNPPIDSIRESVIMSLEAYVGPEKNLLETTEAHAHRLNIPTPFLTNEQLAALKHLDHRGWKAKTIDITWAVSEGEAGMEKALGRICKEAESAISEGYSLVVLSDRAVSKDRVPLSALLATGAVHHHLVKMELRTQISIVVESGEPREVHHICMLVGFGADAINPYLAFEAMWQMQRDGLLAAKCNDQNIVEEYIHAMEKGMRKVFGKMGISTLESYKGAQIFEAVGLDQSVVDRCFAGTASRIRGVGFDVLAKEALARHTDAYSDGNVPIGSESDNNGDFQWRAVGEKHMWDPESIANLQNAVRTNDQKSFDRFTERQNQRSAAQATLRGLLMFRKGNPVPLAEVEPASEIVKRFVTGAMSFGSISLEAHETMAVAMNRLGGKSNTGEGGESAERFRKLPNGDSKRSAIKQVASGRFGVTAEYLTNADEIQIKMAQGAKPGEGGELPGPKVFDIIAKTRHSTPGVGLISPPPHHDIYSIEDLAQLIFDLKNSNPDARISVKLVSEVGVGTIAAGVAKAHADHILISGHDGGTGASPLTGIKHAGLPWELGIAETHQTLVMNDLRSRVVLQTDGQLKTGRDVVIAALLGAEEYGFATAALISMGCVMMRKCEKNTCPVGIATQDPRLRERFAGRPEDVVNFFMFVAEDVRKVMAELGFRSINEMIGRVDMLEIDEGSRNWKSKTLDLTPILAPAKKPYPEAGVFCTQKQDHGIEKVLDTQLIKMAKDSIESGKKQSFELPIKNTDRAVGTMLSHEIAKRYGHAGLPAGTLKFKFKGSAGQSFGAWVSQGVEMELEGDSNDYVGKGLSGGRIVIYPPQKSGFVPEKNIVIGNVAFYGAISGKAFIRGLAAERFCVRNSGVQVVVEGVGDHGCEYMTGGRAVILGRTGRNFAAGMSGGIAYVWDRDGSFDSKCNKQMVTVETLANADADEIADVKALVAEHAEATGSTVAKDVLQNWDRTVKEFKKIIPEDYRKVLEANKKKQKEVAHG